MMKFLHSLTAHLCNWRTGILCLMLFSLQSVGYAKMQATSNQLTAISDTGKAAVSKGFDIIIAEAARPTRTYVADISNSDLGSEQDVKSFFSNYSDNVVSFKVDYQKMEVYIHFLPAAEGAHDFSGTADRNDYLKGKLSTYKSLKSGL